VWARAHGRTHAPVGTQRAVWPLTCARVLPSCCWLCVCVCSTWAATRLSASRTSSSEGGRSAAVALRAAYPPRSMNMAPAAGDTRTGGVTAAGGRARGARAVCTAALQECAALAGVWLLTAPARARHSTHRTLVVVVHGVARVLLASPVGVAPVACVFAWPVDGTEDAAHSFKPGSRQGSACHPAPGPNTRTTCRLLRQSGRSSPGGGTLAATHPRPAA
jgi:hypothetical protein